MKRLLVTSVVIGLIAGLLVGGFHNLFTVPVMERAIVLEEERSASEPAAPAEEGPSTDVSLGIQRIGMTPRYRHIRRNHRPLLLSRVRPVAPRCSRMARNLGSRGRWRRRFLEHVPLPLHQVPPQSSRRRRRGHFGGAATRSDPVHGDFRCGNRRTAGHLTPYQSERAGTVNRASDLVWVAFS